MVARLCLGLAVVAALAATSHALVAQSIPLVREVFVSWVSQAPQAAHGPLRGSERSAIDEGISTLLNAAHRFERAVYARAGLDSPDTREQFEQAQAQLMGAGAYPGWKIPVRQGFLTLEDYRDTAGEFIRLSDLQRSVLQKYSKTLGLMNLALEKASSRAWRLFGRVIERESLVGLREALGGISRGFDELRFGAGDRAQTLLALEVSESAFKAAVERNRESLARSQGSLWLKSLRLDLAASIELRKLLEPLQSQQEGAASDVSEKGLALIRSIISGAPGGPSLSPLAAPASVEQSQRGPNAAALEIPNSAGVPGHQVQLAASPLVGAALIVGATILVVCLLLAVAFLTVHSVVKPVKGMLAMIARLERGELAGHLPRGGVKELDTLACAINRMAAELTIAQQASVGHQQQLEAKVRERTQQLQQLADHDPLTQLPNRRKLFALLAAALEHAAIERRLVGVFFLDIDNFKNLNDSMGHAFGDRVLVTVAKRLVEFASEVGFAARLGGDEFTVVCEKLPSIDAILDTGAALVKSFQSALRIEGREVGVSVSVGASIFPEHGAIAEELMSAAGSALLRAKGSGRRQLVLFTPELSATAATKYATEQGLRRAIKYQEFELCYQPEVSLETLEVVVAEALIRWRAPDGKLVLPGEFLPIAEESGLMGEISDWVLRTAVATAAHWHHGEWPGACVAINVASRQLLDQQYVAQVQTLLTEYRLPAGCLELELTESMLQTGPATIETLHRLRSLGIAIALDDFGTGYSSITSLEQLPITRVKLDRSLISRIDKSPRSAAIARASISLCNSLGLDVTAEGIERSEQLVCLTSNRAMALQGFLLSRPVRKHELLKVRTGMPEHMASILLHAPPISSALGVIEITERKARKSLPVQIGQSGAA